MEVCIISMLRQSFGEVGVVLQCGSLCNACVPQEYGVCIV